MNKGDFMSVWQASVMRVADLNGFVDHMNNTMIDKMRGVGASDVQGQRIILGGEAAGTVNVTGEWDSVDAFAAAAEELEADPGYGDLMQNFGVTLLRRSLMTMEVERGERTGAYSSGFYARGPLRDQATLEANADAVWANLSEGANGMAQLRITAGAEMTGVLILFQSGDSLDAILEASLKNLADPNIQAMMADQDITPIGRVLGKRLF